MNFRKNIFKVSRIVILYMFFSFCPCFSSLAQAGVGSSGQVNRQTLFNNVTDFFATVGKNSRQAKRIKQDRKAKRRRYRQRKLREKKQARIHKNMQRQRNIIQKKIQAKQQARQKEKK